MIKHLNSSTAIAVVLLCLTACSSVPPPPQEVKDLGVVLDTMASNQAQFGTIAVSAPILADPSATFAFDPGQTAANFYSDAKTGVQGNVAEFQQSSSNTGIGLSVSVDPMAAAGYMSQLQQYEQATAQNAASQAAANQRQTLVNTAAEQRFTAALSAAQSAPAASQPGLVSAAISAFQAQTSAAGPTTLPSFPTPPAPTTMPSLVNPAAQQTLAGYQQLLSNASTLSVTDRTALITAAGDTVVQAMFKVMGQPELAQTFHNKRVLFGVCTVSVNPGWETIKGYAANVAMICDYEWTPARATLVNQFIKDPKNPAPLRIRLALDYGVPVPTDSGAMSAITKVIGPINQTPEPEPLFQLLARLFNCCDIPGSQSQPITLTDSQLTNLGRNLGFPEIPQAYVKPQPKDDQANLLVAAVSPLTDVQTLNLGSSYRNQQALAVSIAAQLQLVGASAAAQIFSQYASSLQQDVDTLTPDVVTSSYSTGTVFGFQVGPQLRAVAKVKTGKPSGPSEILERQSFPALVVFGFDASDIQPRVSIRSDGHYVLEEREVQLASSHKWVSLDSDPLGLVPHVSETDLLQLAYWLDQDKHIVERLYPQVEKLVDNRVEYLAQSTLGSYYYFSLPEEIINPPTSPTITDIQPHEIYLPDKGCCPTSMVIEGTNLNTVDLQRTTLVSGGTIRGEPRLIGNVIAVDVDLSAAENPRPLIFSLPTISGSGAIFSSPIIPYSGGKPAILDVFPKSIALDQPSASNPTRCEVLIMGRHLDQVTAPEALCTPAGAGVTCSLCDSKSLSATDPWQKVCLDPRLHNSVRVVEVSIKSPISSLALKVTPAGSDPIFTQPIAVINPREIVTVSSDSYSGPTNKGASAKATVPDKSGQKKNPADALTQPAVTTPPASSAAVSQSSDAPAAKPVENFTRSNFTVEYSPNVPAAVVSQVVTAATRPSSSNSSTDKSSSQSPGFSLQQTLTVSPSTQPSSPAADNNGVKGK